MSHASKTGKDVLAEASAFAAALELNEKHDENMKETLEEASFKEVKNQAEEGNSGHHSDDSSDDDNKSPASSPNNDDDDDDDDDDNSKSEAKPTDENLSPDNDNSRKDDESNSKKDDDKEAKDDPDSPNSISDVDLKAAGDMADACVKRDDKDKKDDHSSKKSKKSSEKSDEKSEKSSKKSTKNEKSKDDKDIKKDKHEDEKNEEKSSDEKKNNQKKAKDDAEIKADDDDYVVDSDTKSENDIEMKVGKLPIDDSFASTDVVDTEVKKGTLPIDSSFEDASIEAVDVDEDEDGNVKRNVRFASSKSKEKLDDDNDKNDDESRTTTYDDSIYSEGDDEDGTTDTHSKKSGSGSTRVLDVRQKATHRKMAAVTSQRFAKEDWKRAKDTVLGDDTQLIEKKIEAIKRQLKVLVELEDEEHNVLHNATGLPLTNATKRFFIGLYCVILLIVGFDRSGFAFANFLRKLTIEKEIYFEDSHIKKTFQDTSNLQELWQWIHGPFIGGLYGDQDGFARSRHSKNATFVYGVNRLLGQVRIRIVRVQENVECDHLTEDARRLIKTSNNSVCFPSLSRTNYATEPYNGGLDRGPMFVWQDVPGTTFVGRFATYPAHGYVAFLDATTNGTQGLTNFIDNELIKPVWTDEATRGVFIEFALLSAATGHILTARFIAEIPAVGGLLPRHRFRVVERVIPISAWDWFIVICYVIMFVLTLETTYVVVSDIVTNIRDHIRNRRAAKRRLEKKQKKLQEKVDRKRGKAQSDDDDDDENTDEEEFQLQLDKEAELESFVGQVGHDASIRKQIEKEIRESTKKGGGRVEGLVARFIVKWKAFVKAYIPPTFYNKLTILNLAQVIFGWGTMITRLMIYFEYTIYLNSMIELYESNASIKYVDAQQLGEYQNYNDSFFGWLSLTTWPLFAMHLAASSASLFQVTVVVKAMGKFADFAFIFFGVLVGMSQAMHMIFHGDMFAFRNYPASFVSTLQALLGSYDYNATFTSSPAFAPIMYLVLAIFGTVFVLNLIISFLGTAIGDAEQVFNVQKKVRAVFDRIDAKRRQLTLYRNALEDRLHFLKKGDDDDKETNKNLEEKVNEADSIVDEMSTEYDEQELDEDEDVPLDNNNDDAERRPSKPDDYDYYKDEPIDKTDESKRQATKNDDDDQKQKKKKKKKDSDDK